MKTNHRGAIRNNALAVLHMLRVKVNQDFHTLSSEQVEQLLAEADRVHYRKPRNANGSRARYFYAKLSREARRPAHWLDG